MFEILIDNKNGRVWDVSKIAKSLTWTTIRVGKPATVEFTLISSGVFQDPSFTINAGDVVRVRKDDVNVFYGYVFKLKQNQDGEIGVTAYDQVRYLLNKDTYVFKNVETGDIIRQIAADFKLKVGRVDPTGYKLPSMVEDGQTLLDIVEKANTLTLDRAGQFFVFFDDFLAGFYIGDESLLTAFDYGEDIDSDTYNQIKLYQDNKKTGKREVYQARDSANIAKWGVLQLYQSVDDNLNAAQINQMLTQLAALKNRVQRSLKLEAVGDIRVRAGMYLPVAIRGLDINVPMLVDEVKHSFDGADHTMSITLKVI